MKTLASATGKRFLFGFDRIIYIFVMPGKKINFIAMPVKKSAKPKKVTPKVPEKSTAPEKKPRVTLGVVVSDKMDKTVVVKVDTLKKHLKYHKRYSSSKKYKVHDPKNRFKIGDKVSFTACRPISKDKQWKAVY